MKYNRVITKLILIVIGIFSGIVISGMVNKSYAYSDYEGPVPVIKQDDDLGFSAREYAFLIALAVFGYAFVKFMIIPNKKDIDFSEISIDLMSVEEIRKKDPSIKLKDLLEETFNLFSKEKHTKFIDGGIVELDVNSESETINIYMHVLVDDIEKEYKVIVERSYKASILDNCPNCGAHFKKEKIKEKCPYCDTKVIKASGDFVIVSEEVI